MQEFIANGRVANIPEDAVGKLPMEMSVSNLTLFVSLAY